LMVASEMGGCFQSDCRVRLANSGTWPHRRAFLRVERAGLKSTAWANATSSAAVALPRAALAWRVSGWVTSKFPEFGGQGVVALEDNSVVVANGDSGGIKGNIAASIT